MECFELCTVVTRCSGILVVQSCKAFHEAENTKITEKEGITQIPPQACLTTTPGAPAISALRRDTWSSHRMQPMYMYALTENYEVYTDFYNSTVWCSSAKYSSTRVCRCFRYAASVPGRAEAVPGTGLLTVGPPLPSSSLATRSQATR